MEYDGTEYNPEQFGIPKLKTHRSDSYKDWLKTQPCCACGQSATSEIDTVPSHSGGGMAIKGPDYNALPLCSIPCHSEEHDGAETFWTKLWARTGKTRIDYVREHRGRYHDKQERR